MATNTTQINPPARHISQQQICYLRLAVTFADAGLTKTVGSIPAGAVILKPLSGAFVDTVFNAGTTNTFDIGTAASGAVYSSAGSLTATAFVPVNATTGVFKVTADTVVTVTVTLSGTTATTGSATVVIAYVENNDN
jgi:hypothetical protein